MRCLVAIALLVVPGNVHAGPPDKHACVDAATRGQIQRDDGKFRSALDSLAVCADEACPPVVRESCSAWLAELRERAPRLTIRVEEGDARDVVVRVDGEPVSTEKPLLLDAGKHTVRAEARERPPHVEDVTLASGQSQTLLVRFAAAPPPRTESTAPQTRPIPLAVWILTGVAVLGVAGFTYFGLRAKSDTDRLQSVCAPGCATSDRDRVYQTAVAADVSLGVGILAAIGAGIFYFTRPARSP
jgi:hypothetical protein